MPTYDYKCSECLHEFDANIPWESSSTTLCPECKSISNKVWRKPPSWKYGDKLFLKMRDDDVLQNDAMSGGWTKDGKSNH